MAGIVNHAAALSVSVCVNEKNSLLLVCTVALRYCAMDATATSADSRKQRAFYMVRCSSP